ncbi:FecCD family ABC transporter permease [Pseudokineococcus sp. 1T1Z-3]|uniref:FecCD family ABC transporter permease n=1 Tax=Pseudokineococcus sp. 1T1Z-3 TaxID=3132745 RepID=UPI0030A5F9B3
MSAVVERRVAAPPVPPREPLLPAVRVGPASLVRRPRVLAVTAGFLGAALAVAVLALGVGDYTLTPGQVVAALAGQGSPQDLLVVQTVRLPRVLTGLAAGAALAVAGALLQTTARNALATPDLLGITAGASAGAVAVITLGGRASTAGPLRDVGVPAAALAGAALASAIVLLIVRRSGFAGTKPLLVGVGVSAFFAAVVSWLLIAAPLNDASRANVWLTGSLNQRSWPELWPLVVCLAAAVVVLAPLASRLGALQLGPDLARATGAGVRGTAAATSLVAVVLTAVAAASVGPMGFVALVAPHAARLASGSSRPPLLASACCGALFLAASDLVARMLLAPLQLPAGAVVAVVGGPFLAWLLVVRRRRTT